ncbi:histone chaperone NAP1 [Sugiyamaella lignohabitans]|uniref:Histone chaperone NAP1 n=1 Tax=Sugiyamaella lignohabitans TaxID=796027 RepID=A0A167E2W0_9ASCO|nr:histone chaperone NAP1 [Sugiyamaella lignohabitans]ANB13576.1 histone chaperone NAP1 [Sugiyamaella lignohabitans]
MGEPIRNRRLNDLANAPTPQNTPSTAVSSFAGRGAGSGAPTVSTILEEDGLGGRLANNPALLSMIEGKLGKLVGHPSGYIESLPSAVRDRISGLKGIQLEHSKLEAQFQEELLALEKKFHAKYEPLYAKRAAIINGSIEPSVEEIVAGKAVEEEDDEEDEDELDELDDEQKKEKKEATAAADSEDKDEDDGEDIKGIPEFWLTAIRNLYPVAETITDRDEEALRYLTDIRMKYLDQPGFALEFEFSENPFFTNKVLTKTYFYQEQTGYGGDFIYDHAEGDKINWTSPENNLTVTIEKRKQRNKHTKATRTIEKTIPAESFFGFFSPPKSPGLDDDDEEGEEEEDIEDIEQLLEVDYQLGEEIKEKLIPRAIDWYTGEALQYEDIDEFDEDAYDEDEDDEDDDDEDEHGHSHHRGNYDDSDDDDDDDDDDEEDSNKPGSEKKSPQECKQQ